MTDQGTPSAATSVREKVVWVLTRTQDVLAGSIGLGGVAAVVADSDPGLNAAFRDALRSAPTSPSWCGTPSPEPSGSTVRRTCSPPR